MYKESEVKRFLNRDLVDACIRKEGHLVNIFGCENGENGYGFKWYNYYKNSFSVKYDWVNPENIPNIIRFVKESKFGDIIKCSVSTNMSHGFKGVVFNVKYKDIERDLTPYTRKIKG